jgi:methyl-accepting chemotaxis protein
MPLIAGGAALAGLAGAAVIAATSRSGRRKKVLGVKLPKQSGLSLPSISLPNRNGFKGDAQKIASAVTDAAKRADNFGQSVSKVATSVQNVSETAEQAVKKA